jgi:hypothetical protein
MTTERRVRPFLLNFSEKICESSPTAIRYDANEQVAYVLLNEQWLKALEQPHDVYGSTKKTGVGRETTDDD